MDSMQFAEPKSDLDRTTFSPDRFTFVRVVYDSQGGPGEAYYPGDGEWRPAGRPIILMVPRI